MKSLIAIILAFMVFGCTSIKNPVRAANKESGEPLAESEPNIEWEAFDFGSTVSKTGIKADNLEGYWEARRSVLRFGSNNRVMKLDKPMIIEIKGNTYRRTQDGPFQKFSLVNNLFIGSDAGDTGVINKITATEFTVSWRNNENYTRYYYAK
jgi:hypothetical protein